MVDVGQQKQIRVNWKFFSLKIINKDREVPEDYRILHAIGLKALRVAAAVRREFGNDGVGKLYSAMGTSYHHDEVEIDEPSALVEMLQNCGLPTRLAAEAENESLDKDIQADMDLAIAKAGTDVGVPQIVLDGGEGPGFFGPVMSPAPTGEDAVKFWDAIIAAGSVPGFFELKRTREVGPIFGEPPMIH
jgi:2-hydroxychromene-2-carboxylate isomerase